MVSFSVIVNYKDHESHTTQRGKHRDRYCVIKAQDTETRRVCWFYDWSGNTHNGTMMRNHRHELIYISGYMNSRGKMYFAVIQRWGIWDAINRIVRHPVTKRPGYIEVLGVGDKNNDDGT